MNSDVRARFETEFAPHIAARVLGLYRPGEVKVDVVPHDGQGSPTCVEVIGLTSTPGLSNRLNVRLAWRDDAIDALLAEPDRSRFDRYLAALPVTIERWQMELPVDFSTRTQRDREILIGDLDFDA
ncbi:hypothetical protein CUJ89_35030 [Burkholderia pyrrocinia]|uniref:DUF5594 domain-containing protein n=1 Tax=Burkholderia pyrrocinia TaxID=60550 RepID=A0A2Z5N7T8_BURPY|nr:DUF5594 family protein [Burkholderia pyrrocinia]AXF25651.1 hypothetical protein CUJ89_35030 [Burkholderia pyrrocinia]